MTEILRVVLRLFDETVMKRFEFSIMHMYISLKQMLLEVFCIIIFTILAKNGVGFVASMAPDFE